MVAGCCLFRLSSRYPLLCSSLSGMRCKPCMYLAGFPLLPWTFKTFQDRSERDVINPYRLFFPCDVRGREYTRHLLEPDTARKRIDRIPKIPNIP